MLVLDTNVVSEFMRGRGHRLEAWVGEQNSSDLYTSTVTLGEVHYGVARLPAGKRRNEIESLAEAVFGALDRRTLVFDRLAATAYGDLLARSERRGRPMSHPDAQIAAIVTVHRATLVTRNVRDFEDTGIGLVNPFGY